jgi:peroxiredoxin
VAQHLKEFEERQTQILAVSFTPPSRVASFLKGHPLPFPAVSDPERQAYRTFSLDKTTWWQMLRPASMLRYVKLMIRGWGPKKPAPGEDVLQLGGDFVLDAAGSLVFAYRSTEPTDRPTIAALLAAVAKGN